MTRNQILMLLAAVALVAFLAARLGAGTSPAATAAPPPSAPTDYGVGNLQHLQNYLNGGGQPAPTVPPLYNVWPSPPPSQDQTCRQLGYVGAAGGMQPGCR